MKNKELVELPPEFGADGDMPDPCVGCRYKQNYTKARKAVAEEIKKVSKWREQDCTTFVGDKDSTGGRINLSETYYVVPKSYIDKLGKPSEKDIEEVTNVKVPDRV